MKHDSTKSKGFTIIEVLIVLAIAGLIMLVVFLAVPNLQRNSRNNQYRAEASNLLGAYSEISSNNNGAVLGDTNEAAVLAAANVQNITALDIQPYAAGATVTAIPTGGSGNQVSVSRAIIRTGSRCAGATSGTATQGSTRQIALYFIVETTGGGVQLQCQDS